MKMKDGSTRLSHKAEHVVDLGEEGHGVILAVVRHDANRGDTQTLLDSVNEATWHLQEIRINGEASMGTLKIEEVVTDKAYHSNDVLKDFEELDLRTYVAEPDRGGRKWRDDTEGESQALSTRIDDEFEVIGASD